MEPLVDALNLVIPVIQSALIGLNLDGDVRNSLMRLMNVVISEMKVKCEDAVKQEIFGVSIQPDEVLGSDIAKFPRPLFTKTINPN